ncbi:MAG: addiction module protein [Opitutaceae bacterium]|nr:addiction module protein [Opitutaceae bacterium]
MSTGAELTKLPVADKLALIDALWASIPEAEITASDAQWQEAQSRLRELMANPSLGLTYEQLKARLG